MTGPREAAARRAEDVARLLDRLEVEGVQVVLNAAGDGVRLEAAAPPSAELVRMARTHRAALLETLAPAKAEAAGLYSTSSKSPDPSRRSSFAEQLGVLAQTPGHCGVCARWAALPAPLTHLGACNAGRRAHGWQDGSPAAVVEIHQAHECTAWEGKGFQAKTNGKRYGPSTTGQVAQFGRSRGEFPHVESTGEFPQSATSQNAKSSEAVGRTGGTAEVPQSKAALGEFPQVLGGAR